MCFPNHEEKEAMVDSENDAVVFTFSCILISIYCLNFQRWLCGHLATVLRQAPW